MNERTGRLEERIDRLQIDTTHIRTDVRHIDEKVDAAKDDAAKLRVEMKDGFMSLGKEIAAGTTRIAVVERVVLSLEEGTVEIKNMIRALDASQRKLAWACAGVCAFVVAALGTGYVHLIVRSDDLRAELTARSDELASEQRKNYERLYEKLSELQSARTPLP